MTANGPAGSDQPEIGGYFGLEIPPPGPTPHSAALALNSARNCFLYTLLALRPNRVYLPAYLCSSMLEPCDRAGIRYVRYGVDANLEIAGDIDPSPDELLLYVNYFGIKSSYSQTLAARYGQRLVIDNSQAFFSPAVGSASTMYSPRKFFGVADGGYLYGARRIDEELETDVSYDSALHLLGRIDRTAADFFPDYRRSEQRLAGRPLRLMSALTKAILGSIDYRTARLARERNFLFLHAALQSRNLLPVDTAGLRGPMVYPLLTDDPTLRQRLLMRRIYVATYWPEVLSTESASPVERRLAAHLMPLPVDQRYGLDEMQLIAETVCNPSPIS